MLGLLAVKQLIGVGGALRVEELVLEGTVGADGASEGGQDLKMSIALVGGRAEKDHAMNRAAVGCFEAEPASLLREIIGPEEIHLGRSPGHRRNFLDCVKSRKQPFATAEIGHRTGTICHAFNIAMTLGRKLEWDPVGERFIGDERANRMLSRPMRSPWNL